MSQSKTELGHIGKKHSFKKGDTDGLTVKRLTKKLDKCKQKREGCDLNICHQWFQGQKHEEKEQRLTTSEILNGGIVIVDMIVCY